MLLIKSINRKKKDVLFIWENFFLQKKPSSYYFLYKLMHKCIHAVRTSESKIFKKLPFSNIYETSKYNISVTVLILVVTQIKNIAELLCLVRFLKGTFGYKDIKRRKEINIYLVVTLLYRFLVVLHKIMSVKVVHPQRNRQL